MTLNLNVHSVIKRRRLRRRRGATVAAAASRRPPKLCYAILCLQCSSDLVSFVLFVCSPVWTVWVVRGSCVGCLRYLTSRSEHLIVATRQLVGLLDSQLILLAQKYNFDVMTIFRTHGVIAFV